MNKRYTVRTIQAGQVIQKHHFDTIRDVQTYLRKLQSDISAAGFAEWWSYHPINNITHERVGGQNASAKTNPPKYGYLFAFIHSQCHSEQRVYIAHNEPEYPYRVNMLNAADGSYADSRCFKTLADVKRFLAQHKQDTLKKRGYWSRSYNMKTQRTLSREWLMTGFKNEKFVAVAHVNGELHNIHVQYITPAGLEV